MTRMIRRTAAACALGLTTAFSAAAQENNAGLLDGLRFVRSLTINGDRLPLPVCKTADGVTARYIVANEDPPGAPYAYKIKAGQTDAIREMQAEGMPTRPGAYIVLSKSFLASVPPETRRHIIAHECAHHILGHTARHEATYRQIQRAETEADCAAVKIMSRNFGMSSGSIRRALEFFKDPMFQGEEQDTHGNGTTRYKRGLACMVK